MKKSKSYKDENERDVIRTKLDIEIGESSGSKGDLKKSDVDNQSVECLEVSCQLHDIPDDNIKDDKTLTDTGNKKSHSKWWSFGKEEDRDPNNIHGNIDVSWSKYIAEPKETRSLSFGWKLAKEIYEIGKVLLYVVLALLLGPLFALTLAIIVAILAFLQIWCWVPCVGICNMICEAAPCSDKVKACCECLGKYFRGKLNPIVPGAPGPSGGGVGNNNQIIEEPILIA